MGLAFKYPEYQDEGRLLPQSGRPKTSSYGRAPKTDARPIIARREVAYMALISSSQDIYIYLLLIT